MISTAREMTNNSLRKSNLAQSYGWPGHKIRKALTFVKAFLTLSGWRDSNPRPPAPHAGAIPGYATTRLGVQRYKNFQFRPDKKT